MDTIHISNEIGWQEVPPGYIAAEARYTRLAAFMVGRRIGRPNWYPVIEKRTEFWELQKVYGVLSHGY